MKNPTWMLVFLLPLALGCPKRADDTASASKPHAATPVQNPPPGGAQPAPSPDQKTAGGTEGNRATMEACVDKFLADRKLNEYGDPADTMYMGGTPLFNEQTGKTIDRLEYVFSKQPEAKKLCAPNTP